VVIAAVGVDAPWPLAGRAAARQAGQAVLRAAVLEDLITRYRAITAAGLAN
jgi:hypothetical protein